MMFVKEWIFCNKIHRKRILWDFFMNQRGRGFVKCLHVCVRSYYLCLSTYADGSAPGVDQNWPNSVRWNGHRLYFTGVVFFHCIWEYVCANVLICAAKKLHYYITYPTKDAGKDIALKLYGALSTWNMY